MRPRMLTRTFKTFCFSPFSTNSPSFCTNPAVFFFLDTPVPLFLADVFDPRSPITFSSKISGVIWRRSEKAVWKIESSCFSFFGKDQGITGLGLYIRSGPSRIRSLDTRKSSRSSCFSVFACDLASFSFFLFSASHLLLSTSSKLNTRAL